MRMVRGFLEGFHHDLKIESFFADALVNINERHGDGANGPGQKPGEKLANIRPDSRQWGPQIISKGA